MQYEIELPENISALLQKANAYILNSNEIGRKPEETAVGFMELIAEINFSEIEAYAFSTVSHFMVDTELFGRSEVNPNLLIKSCEILANYGKPDSMDVKAAKTFLNQQYDLTDNMKETTENEKQMLKEIQIHVASITGFLWASDGLGRFYVDSFKEARKMFRDEKFPDDVWTALCILSVTAMEKIREWETTYDLTAFEIAQKKVADFFKTKYKL